jgi:hypothetical protein
VEEEGWRFGRQENDRHAPDVEFYDLPEDSFPFSIKFFRKDTDELLLTEVVTSPGAIVIPPLAKQLGVEIYVTVEYPDGQVVVAG